MLDDDLLRCEAAPAGLEHSQSALIALLANVPSISKVMQTVVQAHRLYDFGNSHLT